MASSPLISLQTVASQARVVGNAMSRYTGQVPEAHTELTSIVRCLFGLCSSMHNFETAARNYGLGGFIGDVNVQLGMILREATALILETEMILGEMELAYRTKGATRMNRFKQCVWMIKEQEQSLVNRLESQKESMSLLLASLHANPHAGGQTTSPLFDDFDRMLTFDDYGIPESPVSYRSPTSPHSGVSGWSGFSGVSTASPVSRRHRSGSFGQRMQDTGGYFDRGFSRALPPNPHFAPMPTRPKSAYGYRPPYGTELVSYVDPLNLIEDGEGSNSSQESDYRYRYGVPAPQVESMYPLALQAPPNYMRRKSQPNIHKINLGVLTGEGPPPPPPPPAIEDHSRPRRHISEHWASKVFGDGLTQTKFQNTPDSYSSKCLGRPMSVIRKDTEDEILFMRFSSTFIVRFWRCKETLKNRIVCQVGRRGSAERFQSEIDMSWLTIWREGPLIHLRFKNTKWATLLFSCIEDLVVFYMTFLVLRQLGANPPDLDYEMDLDEEFVVFSGLISDDEGGEHFLRVFRDENTGAVRLAAFVKDGDFHQLPVWTAFVSSYIHRKGWLQRQGPRVQLQSIYLISFSDNWATRPYKKWELLFSSREDARDFEKVFKLDLRQEVV